MGGLKRNFSYGHTKLPSNIFYSPLAGCSNLPFRQMSARYGRPGLHYCEMVKMEALARCTRETYRLLDYTSTMHPIGAQLVGSNPKLAGPCARILEEMGFDAIDLNCGCPVDKVTRDGSGSGLLQKPYLIGEILSNMSAAVKIPISVKIRAGWDEKNLNATDIAKIAKSSGAVALTLHARTREQAYRGPANWDLITECKKAVSDLLIFGNGDIFSAEAAKKIFAQTGCDGIMVSRGTMGNPWLAQDIADHFDGKKVKKRSLFDILQTLEEHYCLACDYLQERQAIIEMRKVSVWYLEPFPSAKAIRSALAHAKTQEQVQDLLFSLKKTALIDQTDQSMGEKPFALSH